MITLFRWTCNDCSKIFYTNTAWIWHSGHTTIHTNVHVPCTRASAAKTIAAPYTWWLGLLDAPPTLTPGYPNRGLLSTGWPTATAGWRWSTALPWNGNGWKMTRRQFTILYGSQSDNDAPFCAYVLFDDENKVAFMLKVLLQTPINILPSFFLRLIKIN